MKITFPRKNRVMEPGEREMIRMKLKASVEDLVNQAKGSALHESVGVVHTGENHFWLHLMLGPIPFDGSDILDGLSVMWLRGIQQAARDPAEVISDDQQLWTTLEEVALSIDRVMHVACDQNFDLCNSLITKRHYVHVPEVNCVTPPVREEQAEREEEEKLIAEWFHRIFNLDADQGYTVRLVIENRETFEKVGSLLADPSDYTNSIHMFRSARRFLGKYKSVPLPTGESGPVSKGRHIFKPA
jgi:hypothetical protein